MTTRLTLLPLLLFTALLPPALPGADPLGAVNNSAEFATTNDTRLPLVFLLEAQPNASENGPMAGQLLVVRFGETNTALEVSYAVSGSAVNEVDYQALLGRVQIPAGEHVAPIVVTPVDDSEGEPRETVVVELSHPAANLRSYRIQWPGRGIVSIQDNDGGANQPPTVSLISPPTGAVFRGPLDLHLLAAADDTDGLVQTLEFFSGNQSLGVVSNRFGPAMPVDLTNVETTINTAGRTPGDEFDPTSPSLTAGGIALPPIAPFSLIWSNAPVGEHLIHVVATDNQGASRSSEATRVRIEADTTLPRVGVFARDSRAGEGGSDGVPDTATFVVHRTGATTAELTVDLRFGGSAEAGNDYRTLATTIRIPAGERGIEITIEPLDDNLAEDRESIIVELQPTACIDLFPPPPGCYELGPDARAIAWIEDNDRVVTNRPPVVRLERPETGTVLVAPTEYRLIAAAHDLDGWVRTVEFFDGEQSLGQVTNQPNLLADVTRPAIAILPPWNLVWTNISPGAHALRAIATDNRGSSRDSEPVVIHVVGTNARPVVTIVASDNLARESGPATGGTTAPTNPASFRVRRTGPTDRPLTVHFHIGGTAGNGADYQTIAEQVTLAAGSETAEILISPIDDNAVEGPENIVLSLRPTGANDSLIGSAASDYIIGAPFRAEAILHDNDHDSVNRPPEGLILHPVAGAVLKQGEPIRILARGKDVDGYLVRIEAFADGQKIAEESPQFLESPPVGMTHTFELTWQQPTTGEHELRVRVTDNAGGSSLSQPVRMQVIEHTERTVIGVVALDAEAAEAAEGPVATSPSETNVGVFSLRRRGNLESPVEVAFALRGSATWHADFELSSGTAATSSSAPHNARFAAGQSELRLIVRPVDDTLVERTETVSLEIQAPLCIALFPPPPGCYQIGEGRVATISIRDNDAQRNEAPHVIITGPEPGRKFAAHADLEITAQSRDQDGWVTQMEFYAGERKLGDSVVHFLVPPDPNARQRFSLVWTNVPAGEHALRVKATDNLGASRWSEPVPIRVREESAVPIIEIFARDFRAREGTGTGEPVDTATFTIIRRGATNTAIVAFLDISGRAENGVDYTGIPNAVTIPAGETKVDIVITPIDDDTPERGESVVLALTQPQSLLPHDHEIGLHRRAAAMIADNDRAQPRPGPETPASAEALEDGVVHVVVLGDLTEEVVVEGTDNLRDWFEIARGFMADGRIDFVEADALTRAGRFYRVIPVTSGLPVVGAQRVFGD